MSSIRDLHIPPTNLVSPRAIEFIASAPTDKQPYKPQGDGSTVVLLDVPENLAGRVETFWRDSRGKTLRVLIEVIP